MTGIDRRPPHRVALRGDQRAAHLHDLVPVPWAHRRLRRRRRREPARLGRALARGPRESHVDDSPPEPGPALPSYRVWGSPAWVRGVVARAERATLQAVQIPAHQFVEHRVVLRGSCSRRRAGRRSAPATPSVGSPRRSSHRSARTSDHEKLEDAKEHPGRTILALLGLGLLPALGVIGLVWLLYGRERRTGYDREYEQAPPTRPSRPSFLARQAGHGPGLERVHRDALRLIAAGATRQRR